MFRGVAIMDKIKVGIIGAGGYGGCGAVELLSAHPTRGNSSAHGQTGCGQTHE
jgi:N-acetyl-gamma-glutamylphosphate reductase